MQNSTKMYRERIEGIPDYKDKITPWPGLEALRKFMKKGCSRSPAPEMKREPAKRCDVPAEISIINIPGEFDASTCSDTTMSGSCGLFKRLQSLTKNSSSSQLIIVENIYPTTLALLGGFYDIDTQFFAEYTSVITWYQMYEDVPERLPALPSTRNSEDFLSLRYVSTRHLHEGDDFSTLEGSILLPDMEKTRSGHSAGLLKPISAPKRKFPPMAFTRQCVKVWCKKKKNCQGWIGMFSPFC
jgi:hypothetical protein